MLYKIADIVGERTQKNLKHDQHEISLGNIAQTAKPLTFQM